MADLLGRSFPSGIRIILRLEDDLWPIRVDAAQFELALLNVGLNARDAMPDGGLLEIEARKLTLHSGAVPVTGRVVAIYLRDTGKGIDKEVLGRVFEPFFTTKPRGERTGLGLSQAYGFAEQAGGTIRIRSEPGRGTEVLSSCPPPRRMPPSRKTRCKCRHQRPATRDLAAAQPRWATTCPGGLRCAGEAPIRPVPQEAPHSRRIAGSTRRVITRTPRSFPGRGGLAEMACGQGMAPRPAALGCRWNSIGKSAEASDAPPST